MSLWTSRVGFEGFGLQAKPRPAECRRMRALCGDGGAHLLV